MMALVTSHMLNSFDGTHAGGIAVNLTRVGADERLIFSTQMDEGGRLSETVDMRSADPDATYQLLFETGPYWSIRLGQARLQGISKQIVLRFQMPDPKGQYHMPIILSPNGYSSWLSDQPSGQE